MRKIFRFRKTRTIAKDRLKILLISDRVNCSPQMMELLKNDISKVISKYMRIDENHMEVQIGQTGNYDSRSEKKPVLYINIPILDIQKKESQNRFSGVNTDEEKIQNQGL